MSPRSNQVYEFGPFVHNTVKHALFREGSEVPLGAKTYDTLVFLVLNRGRLVGKQELMGSLWADSFVEESNLTQQISMVRKALGEKAGEQKYVVTVSGRGYRFAAEVKEDPLPMVVTDPPNSARNNDHEIQPSLPLAERDGNPDQWHSSNTNRILFGSIAALVLVFVALQAYRLYTRPSPVEAVPTRSLAILPFRNLKQDEASDFLGFSLADAVITKLGYVRTLTVRPSSAVEKYRNRMIDIGQVGAELKVDTLLTGNFIREGDDIRITSQLIGIKDQNILWKGTFDLKYDKLLAVQDHVAQEIVKGLALNLSAVEAERLHSNAPVDPLAYEYYLHGVDLYSRNDFATAIQMLVKSAEIDPRHALTWAHLGRAYQASASLQFGGQGQYQKAQDAYEKALALSPQQIEAHIFMANLLTDTGRVEQSVPLLREAYATNPNHPELLWELGYAYRFAGMLEQSVVECERARQLDPGVKINSSALNSLLYLGHYDAFLDRLPNTEDVAFISFYRGFAFYHKNERERARANFARAYELDPSLLHAQIGKAISFEISGNTAQGLEMLHKAERRVDERGVRDPEAIYKIAQAYSSSWGSGERVAHAAAQCRERLLSLPIPGARPPVAQSIGTTRLRSGHENRPGTAASVPKKVLLILRNSLL